MGTLSLSASAYAYVSASARIWTGGRQRQ
jgi:hypothetical protein